MRTAPKEGLSPEANQDQMGAFQFRNSGGRIGLRAALADGATQSFGAREWAGVLVRSYLDGLVLPTQKTGSLVRTFNALKPARPDTTQSDWVAQGRTLLGGHATLAGITISFRKGWSYRALVVGDTCLFVTDDSGRLRRSFPYSDPAEFVRAPIMISTSPTRNTALPRLGLRVRGKLPRGGTVWLATDELSRWILSETVSGGCPFDSLGGALRSASTFDAFVADLRRHGEIGDDDMSVIRMRRS